MQDNFEHSTFVYGDDKIKFEKHTRQL